MDETQKRVNLKITANKAVRLKHTAFIVTDADGIDLRADRRMGRCDVNNARNKNTAAVDEYK